ncbi:MAG: carbon monoxide dehydrogenase subunit [Actinomycetia bacterium]|nr:carbon monoxide dehydrogenase subunit [Actinomycetes bacterium]
MAIELDNSFTVPVLPEQAWDVLLDVERIAPCMPGASVLSVDGDSVEGQVKVKLGPLTLTYKGTAKFVEKDQPSHTIVLDASGKETRGQGTATASVNAVLTPGDEPGTTVARIHTSLNVTGRPAQFGRSLLPEISGKLIAQFADNLAALIAADGATANPADETAAPAEETAAPAGDTANQAGESPAAAEAPGEDTAAGVAATDATTAPPVTTVPRSSAPPVAAKPAPAPPKQAEHLDAVKFIVVPVLKRVIPVAAVATGLAVLARALLRRRRKSA